MQANEVTSEVFYSKAGLDIVSNCFLVGDPLQKLSQQCSSDFIQVYKNKLAGKKVTVLNILMGGRYYKLHEALEDAAAEVKMTVSLAEVRASRALVDGSWTVKVWHDSDASKVTEEETMNRLETCDVLVIGDTIATGTTLAGVLEKLASRMSPGTAKNVDVVLFSIAGADVSQRLSEVAQKFKSMHTIFANAKFNLDANGTDLGFIGAECDPKAQAFFNEQLGDFQSVMKCACWDWGDRFTQCHRHLEEVIEYYEGLQMAIPQFIQDTMEEAKVAVQAK